MRTHLTIITALLVLGLATASFAQTQQEHEQHHPGGAPAQAQPAPRPSQPPAASMPQGQVPMGQMMPMQQMMQNMPEQCRSAMQNMPQGCMAMMQQMMQGRMGGATPGHGGAAVVPAPTSPATKAYLDSAEKMHGPMMEGLKANNPDVAFVRGMIAHHQGAIDMAKVRLQYGKDEQTKKWSDTIIREQQ